MKIKRVTELEEVLKCVPFETEVRKKGRDNVPLQKMLLMVQANLLNPLFGFFIAYDKNDEIVGYVVTMLNFVPGYESVHLFRIYAKNQKVMDSFRKTIRAWVKDFGIKKKVTITVTKNVKALQRKYGFNPVSINMEGRL